MTAAPSRLTPEELAKAKQLKASVLSQARRDPAVFAEYVLRHELTGARIRLAPMHSEWHELMNRHRRLIIWSHVEGGKTNQIAIARLLYEIGKNPAKRFAVCGVTAGPQGAATKIVTAISKYIEHSDPLHEVFPHLKPALPWTRSRITVRRGVFSKDPTLEAIGARGHPIGSRLDGLVLDDILDHGTTRTKEQREETIKWFESELLGRLTADAWVWVVGNAYYKDDLLHHLAEKRGYHWRRYPVADDNGVPAFPEAWPPERIAKKEEELGGKSSPEAQRQLYCRARSNQSSRVDENWVINALRKGQGCKILDRLTPEQLAKITRQAQDDAEARGLPMPPPATTHTGVDIGVGKSKKSAKTVIYTVLRWPDGVLQLVGLAAGRWSAAEIVGNLFIEQAKFSSTVAVETNGAQKFLLDNAYELDPSTKLYVRAHNTGANKNHPVLGVEGVFIDLARGYLILPSVWKEPGPDDPPGSESKLQGQTQEIREFVDDVLAYDPLKHTGDFLMAAWIAREDARIMHLGSHTPGVGVRVLGGAKPPEEPANDDAEDEDEEDELEGWAPAMRSKRRPR